MQSRHLAAKQITGQVRRCTSDEGQPLNQRMRRIGGLIFSACYLVFYDDKHLPDFASHSLDVLNRYLCKTAILFKGSPSSENSSDAV
ncbi:hypothetical protein D9601_19330 [Sphingomonas sp. MA1305]|nr:hypothetical protein [Sphingomonas sp. MA1305]